MNFNQNYGNDVKKIPSQLDKLLVWFVIGSRSSLQLTNLPHYSTQSLPNIKDMINQITAAYWAQ